MPIHFAARCPRTARSNAPGTTSGTIAPSPRSKRGWLRRADPRRSAYNPPDAPHGLNIVAIGGGTGLSTLLRGLKAYVDAEGPWSIADLGAIVTVTDEGGSSGVLRKEFGMLPPGDIRNCIVALAEEEQLLSRLFSYRFDNDESALERPLARQPAARRR